MEKDKHEWNYKKFFLKQGNLFLVSYFSRNIYSLRLTIIVFQHLFIFLKIIVTLEYQCIIFPLTIIPLFIEFHST